MREEERGLGLLSHVKEMTSGGWREGRGEREGMDWRRGSREGEWRSRRAARGGVV